MEVSSTLCASLEMGGKFGGERITCVYVWLSPFAVHLKLPQHCCGYTPVQNKKFKVWGEKKKK